MFEKAPRTLLVLLGLNVLFMFGSILASPHWTAGSFVGAGLYLYIVWSALNGKYFALRYLGPMTFIFGVISLLTFIGMFFGGPLSRLVLFLTVPSFKPSILLAIETVLLFGTAIYIWRSRDVRAYVVETESFIL